MRQLCRVAVASNLNNPQGKNKIYLNTSFTTLTYSHLSETDKIYIIETEFIVKFKKKMQYHCSL